MKALWSLTLLALTAAGSSVAADKPTRFWNLTAHTITSFQLALAGTQSWGQDQCQNDRDGTVDHDERLRITGVAPGRYDAKFADKTGRVCIVKGLEVSQGEVFAIDEKDLAECRR
jgi:hypothetical protein